MSDTDGGDHADGIVAELTADHRLMETLFAALERPGGEGRPDADQDEDADTYTYTETETETDADRRQASVDRLTAALVAHIAAEEEYLLPAVREYLADGHQFADVALAANRRTEELLTEAEVASALAGELRSHAREQERVLFPALAAACPPGVLDDLGAKVRAAKGSGPTRPHPASPRNPVTRKALDPVIGLFDRLRDLVQGRRRR